MFANGYCIYGKRCRKPHPVTDEQDHHSDLPQTTKASTHPKSPQPRIPVSVSPSPESASTKPRPKGSVPKDENSPKKTLKHTSLPEQAPTSKESPSATCKLESKPRESRAEPKLTDSAPDLQSHEPFTDAPKTKIESKKEIRKQKKMARKKEKLSRTARQSSREELISTESQTDVSKSDSMPKTLSSLSSTGQSDDLNNDETENQAQDDVERKLTKKERKKEERRMLNVMKKKEKQLQRLTGAKELMQGEKYLEAAIELTRLEPTMKEEVELYVLRRNSYRELGFAKKALEDARTVVGKTPSGDSFTILFDMCLSLGNLDEATSVLARFAAPDHLQEKLASARAGFERVQSEMEARSFKSALTECLKLYQLCPHSSRLALLQAEAQFHMKMVDEPRKVLNRYLRELANEPHFKFVQTVCDYYNTCWWEQSHTESSILDGLQKGIEAGLPWAKGIWHKAKTMAVTLKEALHHLKKQSLDKGRKGLEEALRIDPNCNYFVACVHLDLAKLQDSVDQKIHHLTLALTHKETCDAFVMRGDAFKSRGDLEEACDDFQNALR